MREAEAPLEFGALWVWGCERCGAGLEARVRWRWSGVEQEAVGRWVELETPLEVVVEAPLELSGERERMGWARPGKGDASSGRGCRVN